MDLKAELARFDPTLPVERAVMPPSSWYTDPAIYALEQRTIFQKQWHPAARLDRLRAPGDFVSGCLAGMPWVVVRGQDGELRAFHNVCRHKAAVVAVEYLPISMLLASSAADGTVRLWDPTAHPHRLVQPTEVR